MRENVFTVHHEGDLNGYNKFHVNSSDDGWHIQIH